MTTLGELISQVKNDFRLVHADRRITNKYIYSLIRKHTEWVNKTESERKKLNKSDGIWQTLSCVEVIPIPTTDDCCRYNGPSCTIYRTKEKLPEVYENTWGYLLKSVGTIDGSQDFTHTKFTEWTRKQKNPTSKMDKTPYYFAKNGYLYFPNLEYELVSVTGYFKDDIAKFNVCDDESLDPDSDACKSALNAEWRIPGYLESRMMDYVIKEISATFMQSMQSGEEDINKNHLPTK
jgi:hypothetical protein